MGRSMRAATELLALLVAMSFCSMCRLLRLVARTNIVSKLQQSSGSGAFHFKVIQRDQRFVQVSCL